jgi:hypothetical protein
MSNDYTKLLRMRDISDNDIKQEDSFTFFVKAQSDKHGETIYMVYFEKQSLVHASCTCKDYLFRNTPENMDYECKHIGKVRDLLIRRLNK